MFKSKGIVNYFKESTAGAKVILVVDQGIVDYYRALIPKNLFYKKQMYNAHVSIVRKEIPNMDNWNLYQNKEIEFFYSNIIEFSTNYCWLNVYSKELEDIRSSLGLPLVTYEECKVLNFKRTFHITLGNNKNALY